MISFSKVLVVSLVTGWNVPAVNGQSTICTSSNNVFTMKVNLLAGEFGYITFEECGDTTNPTIGIKQGEVYTFKQSDVSNYYHPLGFAYFADGALDDKDELEPVVTQGSSGCAATGSCPAPMYFKTVSGAITYQGTYSNIQTSEIPSDYATASIPTPTTGLEDFGLDNYEPEFFYPLPAWAETSYSILLKYDDTTYNGDIFYFCHIHQFMTGRIKILDSSGSALQAADTPAIPYDYETQDTFDATCGTSGLQNFQLPQDQCPEEFVCNGNSQFASCVEAMNCRMTAGMTTNDGSDDAGLFLYQMIPHHRNAVNMAKALLKLNEPSCSDYTAETDDCTLNVILREIINNQNAQIQAMQGLLASKGLSETDDCEVEFDPSSSSSCFSADTLVEVRGQGLVPMADLKRGDIVPVGGGKYEEIYAFGHIETDAWANFKQIHTQASFLPLEVTNDHLVLVEGQGAIPAKDVEIGDKLAAHDGKYWPVSKIETGMKQGLYLPLTNSGTIVVNGGHKASTYVSIKSDVPEVVSAAAWFGLDEQAILHMWLSPLRMLCQGVSSSFCEESSYDGKGVLMYLSYGQRFAMFMSEKPSSFLHIVALVVVSIFEFFHQMESTFGAKMAPAVALMVLGTLVLAYQKQKRRASQVLLGKEELGIITCW